MRIDIISAFPDYLRPLHLSLPGKAIEEGSVRLRIHDLREFAVDRHRTVDDAPYGGGPGMVMTAPVWGSALDHVLSSESVGTEPLLVIPSPAGSRYQQSTAADYAERAWLIIACGRYEGIDDRVVEHYSRRIPVEQVSLGDVVLAGGEVAALAICESVIRLLPGVLGNEASVVDDSFSAGLNGLLEGPSYTRPPSWRGLDVPPVLLSGDHQAVAEWRRRESIGRTRRYRPDLLAEGD